jgi:hypothetical protein
LPRRPFIPEARKNFGTPVGSPSTCFAPTRSRHRDQIDNEQSLFLNRCGGRARGASMTRKVYGALGVIAIASTLHIAIASAGPCAGESPISGAPFRDGESSFIGTAPQSIGAQLEHAKKPSPIRSSLGHCRRVGRRGRGSRRSVRRERGRQGRRSSPGARIDGMAIRGRDIDGWPDSLLSTSFVLASAFLHSLFLPSESSASACVTTIKICARFKHSVRAI